MYLKTHKCASSTLQNILYRYAQTHTKYLPTDGDSLSVLPAASSGTPNRSAVGGTGGHALGTGETEGEWRRQVFVAAPPQGVYIGNPEKFRVDMLKHPAWLLPPDGRVNIFATHARLDAAEMRKVLAPDALWITVVRHPVDLYKSLFSYYKMEAVFGAKLNTFLLRPLEELLAKGRLSGRFGPNQMSFDLGYDRDTFYNDTKIDSMIREVEEAFDLVLVAERMDESLVLLGRALCWPLDDLLALRKNEQQTLEKAVEGVLTEEEYRKATLLNYSDNKLYQHFVRKFDLLTQAYGTEKLAEEVEVLRRKREKLEKFCVKEEVLGHDPRASVREYSGRVKGFLLARPDHPVCRALVWNSKQFLDYFRTVQKRLLDGKKDVRGSDVKTR